MRRSPFAALLALLGLTAAQVAGAASIAEQTTTTTLRLEGATYASTGLDASAVLRFTGEAPCSCAFGTVHRSEDGEVWFDAASLTLNGTALEPGEPFGFAVGDELILTLAAGVAATEPEGFAEGERELGMLLEATSPLVDDIEFDFATAAVTERHLHNDAEDSVARVEHGWDGVLRDVWGQAHFGFGEGWVEHREVGSHETCEGSFCSGGFDLPVSWNLTLHRDLERSTATLRLTHHASSEVEVGPMPEPARALALLAGALLLAALPRRR